MARTLDIRKIAMIGDYLPRKCGIATFTSDLRNAIESQYPSADCIVVPVNDVPQGYEYPPEVRFEFFEQDLDSYRRAADFLNFSNADVVLLQHEYGIYGGPAGRHILGLLRDLRMPVVTTLHTILREPNHEQRCVMEELAGLSARLISMSARGKSFLTDLYGVPEHKIDVIAHGIPNVPFVDPNFYKDQFGVEGRQVLLTFGLLAPNKGIEYVLRALPEVIEQFPNVVYLVLGATHPNLVRDEGESYRLSLERLASDLGLSKHVIFYNRFVELHELTEFLGVADIYITPYLNPAQITSGTLAYAYGCGQAVISTPYWHAEELLADGRGVLVPFADSAAITREVCQLLQDESRRHAMRKRAYLAGREMIWSHVGLLFMESLEGARRSRIDVPVKPLAIPTLEERPRELPRWRLDHLLRMTDATGIFQHACFALPSFAAGYCTDDNARALLLAVLLAEIGQDSPQLQQAATTYAAFLNAAFDWERRRFRNFLSFDRCWQDEVGSDDCFGRAMWALGACIGRSKRHNLAAWAARIFDRALPACTELGSPRAWASALLGAHEYCRRLSGDRLVNQMRDSLTGRLLDLYERTASGDWLWFEDVVSYDNAKLPHALILSGRWTSNARAMEVGLRTLRWLADLQRSARGHFRPVGSNGFCRRGQEPAAFDQQPLEAQAMVSAAIEAYHATEDPFWLNEARRTFDWFLGGNDLGAELFDSSTGGCRDGLHQDRANQNQGAESTLSFLLALAELKLLEATRVPFRRAGDADRGRREPSARMGRASDLRPRPRVAARCPAGQGRSIVEAMVPRVLTRCLLRPQDVPPRFEGFEVIGAFNPAASSCGEGVVLLVRVAERPREVREGYIALPYWDRRRGRAAIDWRRLDEVDRLDPRVVRLKAGGQIRLTFLSWLLAAFSRDGLSIDSLGEAPFVPADRYESFGVEDPRLVRLDDRFNFTYVAVSEHGIATALASTEDFQSYRRHGIIFCPENKDVVLFPERVGGQYVALHRPNPSAHFSAPEMWIARSSDLLHWGEHRRLLGAEAAWATGKIGGGTPPVRTDRGWLSLFHGHIRGERPGEVGRYAAALLLLDRDDPSRVMGISPRPVMLAEHDFERSGFLPDVVFPSGLVRRGDQLDVYYGAADTATGVARFALADLLAAIEPI